MTQISVSNRLLQIKDVLCQYSRVYENFATADLPLLPGAAVMQSPAKPSGHLQD